MFSDIKESIDIMSIKIKDTIRDLNGLVMKCQRYQKYTANSNILDTPDAKWKYRWLQYERSIEQYYLEPWMRGEAQKTFKEIRDEWGDQLCTPKISKVG